MLSHEQMPALSNHVPSTPYSFPAAPAPFSTAPTQSATPDHQQNKPLGHPSENGHIYSRGHHNPLGQMHHLFHLHCRHSPESPAQLHFLFGELLVIDFCAKLGQVHHYELLLYHQKNGDLDYFLLLLLQDLQSLCPSCGPKTNIDDVIKMAELLSIKWKRVKLLG